MGATVWAIFFSEIIFGNLYYKKCHSNKNNDASFWDDVLFYLLTAMKDNGYYYAGQIMAMSIAHGGQSPCFLSELLYECLQKGPDNVKVSTDHITDEETRSQVQSVSIFSFGSFNFIVGLFLLVQHFY